MFLLYITCNKKYCINHKMTLTLFLYGNSNYYHQLHSEYRCWLANLFVVLDCIEVRTMRFLTLIVRSPILILYWDPNSAFYNFHCSKPNVSCVVMVAVVRHTTFVAARGGFTIATKWQPLVVAPLLEIVFWCLKHYLRITVCWNSAYLDRAAGSN